MTIGMTELREPYPLQAEPLVIWFSTPTLFEGRVDPAWGTPKDFTVYCMFAIESRGVQLVLDPDTQTYRLRTKTGIFTMEQVFLGEAGDEVRVTR